MKTIITILIITATTLTAFGQDNHIEYTYEFQGYVHYTIQGKDTVDVQNIRANGFWAFEEKTFILKIERSISIGDINGWDKVRQQGNVLYYALSGDTHDTTDLLSQVRFSILLMISKDGKDSFLRGRVFSLKEKDLHYYIDFIPKD